MAIQKLLAQYNLTMEEVDKNEGKEDKILEEETSGYTYKNIGGTWESYLLYVLCKWNFCKSFQMGNSYKKLVMFGKKENLDTVKWLRSFLSERFVSFSKQRYNEYKSTIQYAIHPITKGKYQRSYLLGCVDGLNMKLKKESNNDVELGNKITALVVKNDALIMEYINDKYNIKKGRSKKKYDFARYHGFMDGQNVDIHKPIENNIKSLK